MSELPKHLQDVFAANDGADDLRSVVVGYRRTGGRGGGGEGSGMEVRVAKLESDVEHLKRDVGELRTDMRDVRDRLTRIETRVDHLPSKGFVVTCVVVTLTVMTALITFQDRVQKLVRSSPPIAAATIPSQTMPGPPDKGTE